MPDRPRVVAQVDHEYSEVRIEERVVRQGGEASIRLNFALHDHETALIWLEEAVAEIKSQVQEVDSDR